MRNIVVYLHYTSDSNELFYVGEGTLKRAFTKFGRNIYWQRIVKKHNGFKVRIVAENLLKKEATRLESKIIKNLKKRGFKLCNLLDSTIQDYSRKKGNAWLSEFNKQRSGQKSPTYGLKRPDLILRNQNGNFNRFVKPVKCVELNKTFNSSSEANRFFGKEKSSHITQHIKGKRKTAFGYTWIYA